MSDKKEKPEITSGSAVGKEAEIIISASTADASSQPETDNSSGKTKKTSSSGKSVAFIILFILAIVAGLAASGQLQPLIESAKNNLTTLQNRDEASAPATEPVIAPEAVIVAEPVITPEPAAAVAESVIQTEPVEAVAADPAIIEVPAVSSREVNALLETIDSLRNEMARMEASQRALRNGLHEQQQMNLQVRLRWITEPASRLPQIQLAWEEISLMLNLSAEQRSTAEQMHILARDSDRKLRNWQDTLINWADALSMPVHEDIMPQPEHPWLAWVVGQFHLRQAPSIEARRLTGLRTRLLNAARQLALESWPEQGTWQSLHAELLLQIKAMQEQDESLAVELGLPDNFDAVQADINKVREAAREWARNGQGEV